MRVNLKKISVYLLATILVLGIGYYFWENCHLISSKCCEFESDKVMLTNFEQHESEFNKLIEMAKVDSHVIRIAYDFTRLEGNYKWPRPESEWGISQERWNEYKGIFGKLNIRSGLTRDQNGKTYYLTAIGCGLFTNRGGSKGYAYSPDEPKIQLDSLDNLSAELRERNLQVSDTDTVFKKIHGNWYLYQDF